MTEAITAYPSVRQNRLVVRDHDRRQCRAKVDPRRASFRSCCLCWVKPPYAVLMRLGWSDMIR